MTTKLWTCLVSIAIVTTYSGSASAAGGLQGSISGFISGTDNLDPLDPSDDTTPPIKITLKDVPATLTYWINPAADFDVSGKYDTGFTISYNFGYLNASGGDPAESSGYIIAGIPGNAGGSINFFADDPSGAGSFSIVDPTGNYINSGGTISAAGVIFTADLLISGEDPFGQYIDTHDVHFSNIASDSSGPHGSATPEPSSLWLLAIGIPGFLVGRRRRAGRSH